TEEPVRLYVDDFDGNGKTEQILFHYVNGKEYLFATKDELVKQLPGLKNNFVKYTDFSKAKPEEIFSNDQLKNAQQLEAYEFRSGIFKNNGEMNFEFIPLPVETQFSNI